MGVQIKMVMVGPYAGQTVTKLKVPFTNGVGFVRGPEDKIMHIVKCLKEYGAYPADQAPAEQAKVDAYLASKGDNSAILARQAALKAELAALEAVTGPAVPEAFEKSLSAPIPEAPPAPPADDGDAPPLAAEGSDDVKLEDSEAAETGAQQAAQGGKSSGKRRGNRR